MIFKGDEAIITYNKESGNFFVTLFTVTRQTFVVQKCYETHVFKESEEIVDMRKGDMLEANFTQGIFKPSKKRSGHASMSIMFYYTSLFAQANPRMKELIDNIVAVANQALYNSKINATLNVFCIERSSLREPVVLGNFSISRGSQDATRNTADMAAILVRTINASENCGYAWVKYKNRLA